MEVIALEARLDSPLKPCAYFDTIGAQALAGAGFTTVHLLLA